MDLAGAVTIRGSPEDGRCLRLVRVRVEADERPVIVKVGDVTPEPGIVGRRVEVVVPRDDEALLALGRVVALAEAHVAGLEELAGLRDGGVDPHCVGRVGGHVGGGCGGDGGSGGADVVGSDGGGCRAVGEGADAGDVGGRGD